MKIRNYDCNSSEDQSVYSDIRTNFDIVSENDRRYSINLLTSIFELQSFQYLLNGRKINFVHSVSFACEFYDDRVNINIDRLLGIIIDMFCKKGRLLQTNKYSLWNFSLVNSLVYYRALYADYISYLIKCWWEIELSGIYKGCFEEVSNQFKDYASMFRGYACVAREDFRTLSNGKAMFEAWFYFFLKEKPHIDREFIKTILLQSPSKFLETPQFDINSCIKECMSLKGKSYIPKNLLPDEYNFKLLSKLKDRTNSNFLWFVNFEIQCREEENKLHNDSIDDIIFNDNIYNFQEFKNKKQH